MMEDSKAVIKILEKKDYEDYYFKHQCDKNTGKKLMVIPVTIEREITARCVWQKKRSKMGQRRHFIFPKFIAKVEGVKKSCVECMKSFRVLNQQNRMSNQNLRRSNRLRMAKT